jgi:hypothetical protein
VYCYCCIAQHCLDTGRGYDDLFAWVLFKFVCEVNQYSELDFLRVAWYLEVFTPFNVFEVYLDVRNGSFEDG